ncbi:MAG: ornithine cyclodeaminase family protein [Anaerolineae bacterium]|nr:ornithine cyclodeaminase family protein [Anaerolineae bacterium]
MKVQVINQEEALRLLPMAACIEVMERVFASLERGAAINPLRQTMWLPEKDGLLGMMPAYLGSSQVMGVKVISVFPGNHSTEFDSHQGAVLLFDAQHGGMLAIINASAITAVRTAAVSALATRLLARPEAGDLAILGAGVQAHTHLEAMQLVRDIRRVRVWNRTRARAEGLAQDAGERHGVEVEVMESAQEAVEGAEIVCTTTASSEPVLLGEWLAPGVHINAVGSSVPFARELDTEAVVRSRLYVDKREAALNEAGEYIFAKRDQAVTASHIQGELGEVLLGEAPGRQSEQDITVFKSLGLAIEDLACADYIYKEAIEAGLGMAVDLGGKRYV